MDRDRAARFISRVAWVPNAPVDSIPNGRKSQFRAAHGPADSVVLMVSAREDDTPGCERAAMECPEGRSGCTMVMSTAVGRLSSDDKRTSAGLVWVPGRVASRVGLQPASCAVVKMKLRTRLCRRYSPAVVQQSAWSPQGSSGAWQALHVPPGS